jgi:hypothetical protein
VFGAVRSTAFTLGLRETHWQEHVRNMLRGINPRQGITFVLDPITARQFIDRAGFDSKEKLIQWAYENATLPAKIYWDDQLVQNYLYPPALKGVEPFASMLRAKPDDLISIFPKENIHVVVVGGETNGYWRIMGSTYIKTVSIDDWR